MTQNDKDGGATLPVAEAAKYLGELVAASRYDLNEASPYDVGINGTSIKAWREAYCEGVKDACKGVITRMPADMHDDFKRLVLHALKNWKPVPDLTARERKE